MAKSILIGKYVKIAYDDGISVIIKQGLVQNEDDNFFYVVLNRNKNDNPEGLNKNRVIRVEVIDENNNFTKK